MEASDRTQERDATIVVWRSTMEGRDYLALRRRRDGDGGDWTLPMATAGADERIDDAATRALWEQTGLVLAVTPVEGAEGPPVFAARADADAVAVLDAEHDDHAWLPPSDAAARCGPARAVDAIHAVEHWLRET